MCGCVGMNFERTFSTRLSPALKRSSLVQNSLFPRAKVLVCSTVNVFVLCLDSGSEKKFGLSTHSKKLWCMSMLKVKFDRCCLGNVHFQGLLFSSYV